MLVFRGYALGRAWKGKPIFEAVLDDNPGVGSIGVSYSRDQVPSDMYMQADCITITGISLSGVPNIFYYSDDLKLLDLYKKSIAGQYLSLPFVAGSGSFLNPILNKNVSIAKP